MAAMVFGAFVAGVLFHAGYADPADADVPDRDRSSAAGGVTAAPSALEPDEVEVAFPNLSFDSMVHLTDAGDGSDRLWAVLQEGLVAVFPNERLATSSAVFLDIRSQVTFEAEQGLLGLAFDPLYASNGYFFVYYSAPSPRRSVVSRFSVSVGDPDQADASSELVILEVGQPFTNHNGGTLAFGPDGYLYIGLGDGGSGGDPEGHGQDTSTLLGSILRIDVSGATDLQPYRVPADNPFVGDLGRRARGDLGVRAPEPLEVLVRRSNRPAVGGRRRPARLRGSRRDRAGRELRVEHHGGGSLLPAPDLKL